MSYEQRDRLLSGLGFPSYVAYLNSDLWKNIRRRALARFKGRCPICRMKTEVFDCHHLNYSREVLLGENLFALVLLCRICHRKVEFTEDGIKRSLLDANAEYYRLLHLSSRLDSRKWNDKQKRRWAKKQAKKSIVHGWTPGKDGNAAD